MGTAQRRRDDGLLLRIRGSGRATHGGRKTMRVRRYALVAVLLGVCPAADLVPELGIITTPLVKGQIIARARDPKGGLYETRAVVTPGGDYLLMYPDGGHYGHSSAKINDLLAYRSSDKGKTWQG